MRVKSNMGCYYVFQMSNSPPSRSAWETLPKLRHPSNHWVLLARVSTRLNSDLVKKKFTFFFPKIPRVGFEEFAWPHAHNSSNHLGVGNIYLIASTNGSLKECPLQDSIALTHSPIFSTKYCVCVYKYYTWAFSSSSFIHIRVLSKHLSSWHWGCEEEEEELHDICDGCEALDGEAGHVQFTNSNLLCTCSPSPTWVPHPLPLWRSSHCETKILRFMEWWVFSFSPLLAIFSSFLKWVDGQNVEFEVFEEND